MYRSIVINMCWSGNVETVGGSDRDSRIFHGDLFFDIYSIFTITAGNIVPWLWYDLKYITRKYSIPPFKRLISVCCCFGPVFTVWADLLPFLCSILHHLLPSALSICSIGLNILNCLTISNTLSGIFDLAPS